MHPRFRRPRDREELRILVGAVALLAMGDPATELVRVAAEEQVDLIAMSTHGHRFLQDLLRGSTADRVRHGVSIPVLMVRAK